MSLTIPLNHYIIYIYIYLPGKPWINLLHTVLSIYTYVYYRYWVFYVVWKLETFFGGSNYSFPHLKLKTETDTQLWRNPFGLTFMMHLLGHTFITHLFERTFMAHFFKHTFMAHFIRKPIHNTHIFRHTFMRQFSGQTYSDSLIYLDLHSWCT